jgi:hypothetical protein
MRVRILSGNAAGGEQDVPDVDGQAMLDTGYAEYVGPTPAPPPVVSASSAPANVEADDTAAADTGSE